jgi:tetratricopeptide (TPR) repeat protein
MQEGSAEYPPHPELFTHPVLLGILLTLAADVFVPPAPRGILRDGQARSAKTPIEFPDPAQTWIRVRSAHFDVVSSVAEGRTRAMVRELETLNGALTQDSPRFRRSTVPTRVYLFSRRRESQPYFDLLLNQAKAPVTGLFVRHDKGGAMILDGGRAWGSNRTALHELVHDLLAQSTTHPPLWLEEGLAEYFAGARIAQNSVFVGEPIRERIEEIRRRPRIPLERLVRITSGDADATQSQFYSQSWSAVAWLMRTDRAAFFPFLADLERGVPLADALRTHFRKDVSDLENGIAAPGGARLEIEVRDADTDVTIETLDRASLLYELGGFLSVIHGAEKEAKRHFEGALAADPKHARSLAALHRFDEALAAAPRDAEVPLLYAEHLVKDAIGDFAQIFAPDAKSCAKAAALARQALDLGADPGRAHGILGLACSGSANALAHLERAHELLPGRSDFALHLYAAYLRGGDDAKAEALFQREFAASRDKQVAFTARNIRFQVEADRANALAEKGRLNEAAAIVRELAKETADAKSRAELEAQAAQMESIATINEHIRMYNQAIAASNAGKTRDALKILNELLKVATDAQVVADARKLQRELRPR